MVDDPVYIPEGVCIINDLDEYTLDDIPDGTPDAITYREYKPVTMEFEIISNDPEMKAIHVCIQAIGKFCKFDDTEMGIFDLSKAQHVVQYLMHRYCSED